MLKRADQYNLDWHRNKGVEVKKRGSISLVTPQLSSALAERFSQQRPRCVWPSHMEAYESKYLTRRVWSR